MSDKGIRLVTDMADEAVMKAVQRKRELTEAALAAKEVSTKTNRAIHAFGGEAKIFDLVASGHTIDSLCGAVGISSGSFYDWLEKVPSRAESLTRARARGAHSLAEQTISIADSATREDVQVAKLRSDNRWRLASKLNPEVYGDKQQPLINIDLGSMALDALRKRVINVTPVNGIDNDPIDEG